MDFLTLINEKKAINQAALAVPMALGPNDKFTPFKARLDSENPDAVIWQADAIADDFSKEVIWDQVKQGGARAVDEGEMSAMKKAAMKSELDQAHQEFLANWPSIQQQIVLELVQNAKETAGNRYLFLSYSTKAEGGQGEMTAADQAFFLTSAMKAGKDIFSGVFLPPLLDENLQNKLITVAKEDGILVISTAVPFKLSEEELRLAFQQAVEKDADIINLEISDALFSEVDLAEMDGWLSALLEEYGNKVDLMLTLTGQLVKDQVESWLVLPSILVTLSLSEQYQTAKIKSTIKELGWN